MQYRVMKPRSPDFPTVPFEVEVGGVDFGKRPLLWEKRAKHLVLKIRGGMHWSGRGEQRYGATYFQVCEILEEQETFWLVNELIDFPLRESK